jgi:WD40 repeat protein
MTKRLGVSFALLLLLVTSSANAQYFGRNKVQWENFHFKTLQTPHFDIYYYDQEADVVNDVGRMAERWYDRLSRTFNHTFTRKPIVLYANSADFQQTTTTGGLIGEGTGGFTDEFMNRVVLPLTGNYADNDHVLGHELVHVFQYDIAAQQSTNRRRFSLEQMPLWLVEGMAEYFSKGRIDPLTAMWVRDAAIHNRLPNLKKLTTDPRYFPYRYGEALLAYIGGRFGDDAVVHYFLAAGQVGMESAFERATGLSSKQLFADWQASAHELYDPLIADRPNVLGNPLLGTKTTRGDLNVGPAYSPDGRYLAFLSTRDIFDVDLYLADAKSGRIIRKLVSSDRDPHMDALRFIDSAGSFSPDSSKLAFVVFEKGDNYLAIVDVNSRRIDHIRVPGIDALTAPAWSPDGHTIAISGQATGVTDLYLYDLDTKRVRQLTNDRYADMQPAWSPDGKTLAFVSDRGSGTNLAELRFSDFGISTIDVASGHVETLPLFPHAKHIDPQYGPDGSLYFIANPEGVPDVYRYDGHGIERVTHVQTGVSGITETSPAMSVAARTGEVAFSLYEDDDYNIYSLPPSPKGVPVANTAVAEAARGAVLPPFRATGSEITAYLQNPVAGLPPESTTYRTRPYNAGLHLAYLGPPSIGVGADRYGYGVAGSVAAEFTDILGRHDVGVAIQTGGYASGGSGTGGGAFADQIGGETYYLNQTHRFNWGVDLVHLPYVSIYPAEGTEPVEINGQTYIADALQQVREIQTIDDFSLLTQYPFGPTRRIELSTGVQRYSYKADVETLLFVGNTLVSDTMQKLVPNFAVTMYKGGAAFVGDSSVFGFISPVRGTRYRYEVQALTGDLKFATALADWRKYFFLRPVTFAVRGLHYGRYGSDSESNALTPLYVGEPGLMRGYDPYSIGPGECSAVGNDPCPVLSRLIGSRIAIASAEVRVPILGTKEYGLVNWSFLPTEGFAFADAGEAWHSGQHPKLSASDNGLEPVYSVGAGLRILLSYIPLEFYAAKPFQRPGKNIVYGFNIIPGW